MTFNQLVAVLKKFADDHPQIHQFGEDADLSELGASKDLAYPVMWAVVDTTRWTNREQQYPVRVIFMDQIFQERNNRLEVQSDMLQLAQDLCAHLIDNPEFDFMASTDVPMRFFTDSFADLVAGVDITITVRDPKPLDRCVIPS